MLAAGHRKSLELVETCAEDRPLSVQIFSGVTDDLVRAARWLEAHGYQGVDINMGCPMAKVNGSGGGARLMCNTLSAAETAARVVDAVKIPVTVKMRLGWDDQQLTAPALAESLEQVGVAAITVHGRTRAQGFHGSVNREGFARRCERFEESRLSPMGIFARFQMLYRCLKTPVVLPSPSGVEPCLTRGSFDDCPSMLRER